MKDIQESSVLDLVKSITKPEVFFSYLNELGFIGKRPIRSSGRVKRKDQRTHKSPWKMVFALFLALFAQYWLEPPNPIIPLAIFMYGLSALIFFFDMFWKSNKYPMRKKGLQEVSIKGANLIISLIILLIAFWTFKDNQYNAQNISLWLAGFIIFFSSVWIRENYRSPRVISIDYWTVLFVFVIILVTFFRIYHLQATPGEMFSDHAEKMLDIYDVLQGKLLIFFPRNTGREAIQFYITAILIKLFNTGLTFMSLKLGTVLIGLVTLPFIYLFTREISNRWSGLAALFFAGIAYWPNVISRIGLRFPLYALFAAPCLFYLIRGLRTLNRNDFILSGIVLGAGLHGYSAFRIMPLVIAVGVGLKWLTVRKSDQNRRLIFNVVLLFLTSFILFLPLFRYMIENPESFNWRALSRLTTIEQPYPEPAGKIFISNLWNALTMLFINNGEIWVHSIPNRPALDIVSAAVYFFGILVILKQIIKSKDWLYLYLILLIPLLMLPSILSLAFPKENPSLNRTSAAIIPVFAIIGIGLEQWINYMISSTRGYVGKIIIWSMVFGLIVIAMVSNVQLVFKDYHQQYLSKAWNTSEIGKVISDFIESGGDADNAFVVPYPHWVDTRLVGINAGLPTRDFALWSDQFSIIQNKLGEKLFILKPEDNASLELLMDKFPNNKQEVYISKRAGGNFIIMLVD